jgi:hypothetical protein
VLLIDVFHANADRLNVFKGQLWERFGIASHEFQKVWEYEQYVRLAEPAIEALKAIGADGSDEQVLLLSHEYMGMPTALKAIVDGMDNVKTVFYAHEVASVRPIVEKLDGHDTMFYNVMAAAREQGKKLEEVFPQVHGNFKHPLVKAARYCDHVFAVGDQVVDELLFLDPHFRRDEIDLVYNGIPVGEIQLGDRRRSASLLKEYAQTLLGEKPTWIFSHVARPVLSKGIWRDLRVMHEMDAMLADRGESAVYFMLGTLGGQRRPQDVRHMERTYDWPVVHEYGYPDLCGGEEVVYETFRAFNEDHQAITAVLINQWGFNPKVCGHRMPEGMSIADLRRGTDVEFGLSVYEPFGISQLEPLSYGALCVVSNVCGCVGFARRALEQHPRADHVIVGDFYGSVGTKPLEELLSLGTAQRDAIEATEGRRVAELLCQRLPRDETTLRERIEQGHALARQMSWDDVVQCYLLPSLERVARMGE